MAGSPTPWLPPPDPSGPVTCAACGCRLTETYVGDRRAWLHFTSLHPGQDARGCRPSCLAVVHARDGRPLAQDAASSSITDEPSGVDLIPRLSGESQRQSAAGSTSA